MGIRVLRTKLPKTPSSLCNMAKTHGSKISVTSAWRLLLTPCNFSGPSGIITEPTRAQVVMALDPPKISVNGPYPVNNLTSSMVVSRMETSLNIGDISWKFWVLDLFGRSNKWRQNINRPILADFSLIFVVRQCSCGLGQRAQLLLLVYSMPIFA